MLTSTQFMYMTVPALVAVTGGVLAMLWRPNAGTRSLIQHFAAGVVLAALAVELLPEISREHASPWVTLTAFAAGSLFMYGLKLWTEHLEQRDEHRAAAARARGQAVAAALPMGLIAATLIDIAVDGFIIGASFSTGGNTGPILAIGLSVELLFLGLALMSDALSGWRIVAMTTVLGAEVLGFALLGNWLLAGASHAVIGAALSFSAAALLYLVTEELLIEAHTVEEKPIATLVLFAGFLAFWAIQLFGEG